MKLVLQGLCSEWKTDIEALKGQISSCHQKQFEGKGVSDHTKTNGIVFFPVLISGYSNEIYAALSSDLFFK